MRGNCFGHGFIQQPLERRQRVQRLQSGIFGKIIQPRITLNQRLGEKFNGIIKMTQRGMGASELIKRMGVGGVKLQCTLA